MDTNLSLCTVHVPKPASDVAGDMAAALAASSIAFRPSDPQYADKLLSAATRVFGYADTYRWDYSYNANIKSGDCPFYCHFAGISGEALNNLTVHGTFAISGSDGALNFWDKDSKQR
ncbi:endoglucanase 24 [Artemisia annua]|uniref:cellulase n=1 Tax=Artemisia annua TaxID=35608 RepID=A0A2U1MLZ3_ARTAN|nr:endoglucanase 24 [Artemisia annua]